jgi:hypothetical protein
MKCKLRINYGAIKSTPKALAVIIACAITAYIPYVHAGKGKAATSCNLEVYYDCPEDAEGQLRGPENCSQPDSAYASQPDLVDNGFNTETVDRPCGNYFKRECPNRPEVNCLISGANQKITTKVDE